MTPQELKNSILQLAIQGKLVEQRPEEGTAEELYRQIQQEKQALIKAGKIKKEKPLPEITEDDVSFDIPDTWRWCYIGDVFQHNTGKALNGSDNAGTLLTYITTSNLYWNRFELDKLKEMPFADAEIEKCTVQKGDLLVCEGGDFGRAAIWSYDTPMRIQNHIHRLRPYSSIIIEYFYYVFYLYKNAGLISGNGIGIQGLSANALHVLKAPLPPLPEQKRIVAKIEELLPYIDRYEKAWNRLEDFNKRFPADMQKSILQLAIQGKLVEQRPEEGTGEALYQQIQKEKQALIKAGKIKKEKPLPEITEDEIPFEIPESWKWVRLGEIVLGVSDGPHYSPQYLNSGIPFISTRNIASGILDFSSAKYISKELHEELCQRCKPKKWDVLYSKGGTTGIAAVNDSDIEFNVWVHVAVLSMGSFVYPYYLAMALNSPHCYELSQLYTHGTSNRDLGLTRMVKITLPLPPLAEQKRIVAKLEELLPLCEKLK